MHRNSVGLPDETSEIKKNLWEMITIASPQPDGMIPIDVRGEKDDLKDLMTTIGFEFLV